MTIFMVLGARHNPQTIARAGRILVDPSKRGYGIDAEDKHQPNGIPGSLSAPPKPPRDVQIRQRGQRRGAQDAQYGRTYLETHDKKRSDKGDERLSGRDDRA